MKVETATSGPEALEMLRSTRAGFALVLTDWQMPEMDGIEVTRSIRGDASLDPNTKVILVTAFGREEVRRDAEEAGVDAFLVKPVNQSLLVDALMEVFGAEPVQRMPVTDRDDELPEFDGQRVLLVEDNEINRQVATELLAAVGVQVEIAEDGLMALEKLDAPEQDFALVLMDVQMPRLDGLSATRRIRADARFDTLPVIGLTAHALEEERLKGIEAGMNDQVTKPIDPGLLYAALARWMPVRSPGSSTHTRASEQPSDEVPVMIDGVDCEAGLRRSAGNQTLYHKLLRQFAREQRDAPERIRSLLDGGDLSAIRAQAHTVKGVASNLGAVNVQSAAAAIEAAARDTDAAAVTAGLPDLASALGKVIDAIEEVLGGDPAEDPPPATGPVNAADLDADVQALLGLLDGFDADAVDRFDAIRGGLGQLLGQDTCDTLRQAMDGFEFSEAAQLLRESWDRAG